jgi:DNA (cytosine-5)-methyltransferase 1
MTDLFCGAGGSSSGAIQVPGVAVRMAANHWRLAVETHNTNHPDADHDCADISQVDPRRYPATDILWASPECTNHSQAKGKRKVDRQPDLFGEVLPDEAAERSRATMWDVCRFVEAMKVRGRPYRAFVVENVVDVRQWMFFDAWVMALRSAGYCLHFVYLNSMFAQGAGAPAPQSRDRWYCVGHQAGNRCPDLAKWTSPVAWCPRCHVSARAVQAWKNPDRQAGRYRQQYVYLCGTPACGQEVYPGVLPAAVAIDWTLAGERIGDRAKPLAEKTIARIEAGLQRYARPIHLEAAGNTFERRPGVRAWSVDEPLKTVHTTASKAVACPPMLVPAGGTWNDGAAAVTEPFRTRTTRDTEALVVPVEGRDGLAARPAGDPARTQTARLQDALVVPLRNNNTPKPADVDPLDTVAAAGNHHALVMRNNSSRGDGSEMSTPVDEPLRTLTTSGHQSLIRWDGALVMRNMTARGDQGQMSYPPSEPMRTVLAEQRQSLVRWDHLLVPYYSTRATAREVGDPIGTIKTVDTYSLVGPQVAVEDCTFRMLEPHEIQAAMAFLPDYQVLGNKREQVRQLGNAVTPPAARDLIAAIAESLEVTAR